MRAPALHPLLPGAVREHGPSLGTPSCRLLPFPTPIRRHLPEAAPHLPWESAPEPALTADLPAQAATALLWPKRASYSCGEASQRVPAAAPPRAVGGAHVPKPMRPSVSPRMRAAPEATSRICSTLCTRVPSRSAWYSQVFRRYRLRMWQMVESAVSSTAADGMLHTAIPGKEKARRADQSPAFRGEAPGLPSHPGWQHRPVQATQCACRPRGSGSPRRHRPSGSEAQGSPAERSSQEDCCPGPGSPPPAHPVLPDPPLCKVSSWPALTTPHVQCHEASTEGPLLIGCGAWRPREVPCHARTPRSCSRGEAGIMETGLLLKIVL